MKRTGGLNALQRALKRALQRALKNAAKCSPKARRTLQKALKKIDESVKKPTSRGARKCDILLRIPHLGDLESQIFPAPPAPFPPHAGSFLGGKAREFPAGVFVS